LQKSDFIRTALIVTVIDLETTVRISSGVGMISTAKLVVAVALKVMVQFPSW
jgi:hypothetical protein